MSSEEKEQKIYGRLLPDGSVRLMVNPRAGHRGRFHSCSYVTTNRQWTPDTGKTRYAWERGRTSPAQAAFFRHLAYLYKKGPPVPRPEGARVPVIEPGPPVFHEVVTEHSIETRDPSGEWCFRITAQRWRGMVCDRIATWHHDGRTMPDWRLLMMVRSWVLEDGREALLWLPDQDPTQAGSLERYQNHLFNALELLSPRAEFEESKIACRYCEDSWIAPEGKCECGIAYADAVALWAEETKAPTKVESILCNDCSYGKGREYRHAPPHCAGAQYPKEITS